MYIEEGWGYKRICQELGIPCTKTIRLWVKRYHEHGLKGSKNGAGHPSLHSREGLEKRVQFRGRESKTESRE
ncbi:helix-turn-helix domain-containing protein [Geobacillus zalihae]|uniref:helix-turn-helix domain-containing protein n=1 Tax=Geobacillus zalihae TaxID=213419 RepID=UPI0037BE8F9E